MTMNPFEQSTQQLLRFLTSHAEWEVIDYIRQEKYNMTHRTVSRPQRNCSLSSNPRMRRLSWTPTSKCW